MSNYIGNQPSAGEFKKLDSIASSFNGSLTQFDLDYSTVNQSVGDATQLIVSLNGIIQEPGSAYTLGIGGGSIVFASAPASGDTCHIVLLGGVGGTTTPTDGSVTASKLDASLKDYLEETFTANGSQTVFTLTRAVIGANTLLVTIDGIVQPSSAFTASGTTLTISEVLAANTNVRVVHMGVKAGVYVPANDSITTDMLANSINTDIAAGVAALPKAGGTMTGDLTVEKSAPYINISNSAENIGGIKMYDNGGAATQYFNLTYDSGASNTVGFDTGASGEYTFSVNTDEKMRIDASGNLLVGRTTTPPTAGAKIAVNGTGDTAIELTKSGVVSGRITAVSTGLAFGVDGADGATERMRIDASGNLLVGRTSTSDTVVGAMIRPDGFIQSTRDSNIAADFNRNTLDGDIVRFSKGSAPVGIIGNSTTNLIIKSTSGSGLFFGSGTLAPLLSGSLTDNTLDIGTSSYRYKDLYLSGGVVFDAVSGNATSNTLDDYEEGSWLPSLGAASANPTVGYNAQVGHYTKIGNLVTVSCRIVTNSRSGGSGHLLVRGLPFTVASAEAYASATIGFNYNWNTPPQHAGAQANTVTVLLYQDGRTNAVSGSGDIAASGSSYLNLSCSYITNA